MAINHLEDLFTFVIVVDQRSFTKAAQELGITHSVVSKRINRLEKELGARLLQRSTRRLALTEVGQAFYQRGLQIKKDLDEAVLEISASHEKPHGTLRINAPMSFGQLHLIPAVADFIKLYPDIKIELLLGRQYANLLEEGLDLAIQISELPDSSLFAQRLALRSTLICASPQYLREHGTPSTPQELTQHNCLLYQQRESFSSWRFVDAQGKDLFIKVSGNLIVNSSQALTRAAIAGLGIARLPGYLVNQELIDGSLVAILNEHCPHDIGIYAIYPHHRYLATKVKLFVNFLMERFGKERYWNQRKN